MPRSRVRNDGWRQLTRGAPLAVLVAVALLLLHRLLPVLELVTIAALLALIFRTTLEWFQRFVKVRWIAVLLLVGVVIGFGLFLTLVLLPGLFQQVQILSLTLPTRLNSVVELSQTVHRSFGFIPDLSQGLEQLATVVDRGLSFFPAVLRGTVDFSIETVATLILAIYMAHDPNSLVRGMLRLAPRKQHHRIWKLLQTIKVRLQGWIFGTGLAILIIGAGATIGLWILGIPLALSFGVLAGILEVIPYVGSIVGALLPALVALSISPLKALLVLVLFLVLNQVDAHLVQPLVMAQRVHLHPVMVILAFLVLGNLLGLVGILLAVPAAAVLVTLVDEFSPRTPLVDPLEETENLK
jgi:predicted PurR-regulated permease PerM